MHFTIQIISSDTPTSSQPPPPDNPISILDAKLEVEKREPEMHQQWLGKFGQRRSIYLIKQNLLNWKINLISNLNKVFAIDANPWIFTISDGRSSGTRNNGFYLINQQEINNYQVLFF